MDKILFGRVVDSELDEHGKRQAASLAQRFVRRYADAIVIASPRRRTQQTAAALVAESNCEATTAEELDEIDFGRWSGCTFEQLRSDPDWRFWNEHRSRARTPAGSSIANVQARVMRYLHALAERSSSQQIGLVTHSEIIRCVVMDCLRISPDDYGRIAIDPASLTTIELGNEPRVIAVNERLAA
jgi:broad specificity phosphatase PhoE